MPTTQELWIARIHQAMDRILAQPDRPLDLHAVAASVHSSPFHFHRVFQQIVGETLHAFQKRVRLERALTAMVHGPERSLLEIALDHGFGSASSFSKAFKDQYGTSPRKFDLEGWQADRRGELTEHNHHLARLGRGENPDGFEATLVELPARSFVTRRVTDPFQPGRVTGATEEFVAWAEAEGTAEGTWAGWMWENPDLVPLADCRYDIGLVVPAEVRAPAPFHRLEVPAMTVARVSVRGSIELEQRCLDWLYGTWLPRSGHEPAPWPTFEIWHGRPFAHGIEHFELDIELPIAPG